jgi:hypothetical protein
VILNKTRRFKTDITDWNRRPDIQKTWINFKDHFRRAHQEFRETTDVTLEESNLQQNNANLVQQVVDGMQQAMVNDTTSADSAEVLQQMTNSATRASETQQQLQAQLQQMQHAMGLLQSQVATQGYNTVPPNYNNQAPAPNYNNFYPNNQAPAPNNNSFNQQRGGQNPFNGNNSGYQGRGRGRGRSREGRGNSYRQRNTSIYCWSHGACGHSSANCNNKLAGHQDAATFQNKMNGNTNQCPP